MLECSLLAACTLFSPHAPLMLHSPAVQVAVTPPDVPGSQGAVQVVPLGSDDTLVQLAGQPSESSGLGSVRG